MKYGYDLKNPKERQIYIDRKQENINLINDDTKTIQDKYNYYKIQQQKDIEYFREREKLQQEQQKEIEIEIEKQLPQFLDNILENLLKDFK